MIEVRGLTKRYGEHIAVENLGFQVNEGEIVGFLGPNGAGKTTTMRILAGYMPATQGTAKIRGVDVFDDPITAKRMIGYLPEIPPLYLSMTVREYLVFVARIKGVTKRNMTPEIDRVSALTGITHMHNRLVRNVSKGYKQRVGLAQALLKSPDLLILDEPTVGLDPIQIEQVRNSIVELGKSGRHTIVLSTHILSEVRATCERIIMIARGQIVADANLEELEREHNASLEEIFVKLAVR